MKKIAFVFSGQGAQKPGMGQGLYNDFTEAREVYDRVAAHLELPVAKLGFTLESEQLDQTLNAQPAIFTLGMAAFAELHQRGVSPDAVAGFSLGEVTALCAAGAMPLVLAAKVIRKRAETMQKAAQQGKGCMIAVMGLDEDGVTKACEAEEGFVQPVNFNAPGQVVIAGDEASCLRISESLTRQGARCVRLAVNAAFHSPMMEEAAQEFGAFLEEVKFLTPEIPVYSNLTGGLLDPHQPLGDYLRRQMVQPVQWERTVRAMIADGYDTFVELGPGKTLCGLIRRIDRSVFTAPCDTPEALEKLLTALDGG